MGCVTTKEIHKTLRDLDEFLLAEYKVRQAAKRGKRDWRTYEERYARAIRDAMMKLEPLVEEATSSIREVTGPGRPPDLTLKQRVLLLLLQRLFGKSNRIMASMLTIFSVLSGVEVGYKTVERLYSDEEVILALHNLHVLILKKKGIREADVCGDGTGYSLSISEHYASEVKKRRDDVKKTAPGSRKKFIYSFKLMDTKTQMYVVYGTSLKSEREAYNNANRMRPETGVKITSVTLDKYYSCQTYTTDFEDATVFVLPKKNSTIQGPWQWKKSMKLFTRNTMEYLQNHYQREKSEAGWSADKRLLGWTLPQRRPDRIDTADCSTMVWHNLLQLYR